jgi:hypothetical protein
VTITTTSSTTTTSTTAGVSPAEGAVPAPGTVFIANVGPQSVSGPPVGGSLEWYRDSAMGNAPPLGATTAQAPQGLAFDSSGDLWVTSAGDMSVLEYTNNQLVKASPAPRVTLRDQFNSQGGSLNDPGPLAVASHEWCK